MWNYILMLANWHSIIQWIHKYTHNYNIEMCTKISCLLTHITHDKFEHVHLVLNKVTSKYTHNYTSRLPPTHNHTHTCICTCNYRYGIVYTYTLLHRHIHPPTHTCTHTVHTCTCISIYMYMYVYLYTCALHNMYIFTCTFKAMVADCYFSYPLWLFF